jgi:DNA-binding transcriptional MerR regulator
MKLRIKEFADLTGVSVRTLHYYGEIGLLPPAYVDKHTGYRFYDENSLCRMQTILFYRELDFSLKSIGEILSSPNYDKESILKEQKTLLILKKERLERLISAIDRAVEGENVMNAFDNREFEAYKAEAAQKWGSTDAYREHGRKTAGYSQDKWKNLADDMNAIFGEFAVCMQNGGSPEAPKAQALTKKLQNFITEHYYTCTTEIFAGLGQMYLLDDRFRKNIDDHGQGTAAFVSNAIEFYCRNL